MDLQQYYQIHGNSITQPSERLFVDDFLYPLLGGKIEHIVPQYPFLDGTGRQRRIDFVYVGAGTRLALEVNGETYHAEGIIPDAMFDDNLFRQNEILAAGYRLIRVSYSQLQSPQWRPLIQQTLRTFISVNAPELLSDYTLQPTPLQNEVLAALLFYRQQRGWTKGIVVLPTGTGKTILSALDASQVGGRVLFLVHRLDILRQSIEAYRVVFPNMKVGTLTGEIRENEFDCDVLFASKDTLRHPHEMQRFDRDWFDYVVVDEVHHGQSPTYREVLAYFEPRFMLGMTATPDRTDRRDIFELFDYQKIFEMSLPEAIERGFLAAFTYYGLLDDIDYSKIRYQNNRYRVDDLEKQLIIPERNAAILNEYLDKGGGDKAIGFCVSIVHAERMAAYFQANGITAAAIHSGRPDREELIASFRANEIQVAFTVDLFNEGIDFPNIRVLLFLRPTESKTVFVQQLGRGLRLLPGKNRVLVLDFIGNYQRANQVRKYLSKGATILRPDGESKRKVVYEYSTGCEVHFDPTVEEILNAQDAQELGVTKEDLQEAYYVLAEQLGKKPSRSDIDTYGDHKSAQYARLFGSWVSFIREIGEYTEASYHYPQGVHLGHILSIIDYFGREDRSGTHFDDTFIRLRGNLGDGRISSYRRQVKYKLQAAMELGILTDDRNFRDADDYQLELTSLGKQLRETVMPILAQFDLSFAMDAEGVPSSRMRNSEDEYNKAIRGLIEGNPLARDVVYRVFLNMPAIQQMCAYMYQIVRTTNVSRSVIYQQFFKVPFVQQFCDREGIEEATEEAARHRIPFLLNILNACGIITQTTSEITIDRLVLFPVLVKSQNREDETVTRERLMIIGQAWPASAEMLTNEDLSIVKELFGLTFLTSDYHLSELTVFEG